MAKELYVADREEWRDWLEKNHNTERLVWLIFYKRQTGRRSIPYDDAVDEALCFGWIDSIIKKINEEKYVRKFTPRKAKSRWSQLNRKRAEAMMREGRMTEAGLTKIKEAQNTGEWFKTTPPRQTLKTPQFMVEALTRNKKAFNNFNNLAPSYKRQFIGWITSAQRVETQKKRLAEAIELLEKNEKLSMK